LKIGNGESGMGKTPDSTFGWRVPPITCTSGPR
jgi:hypothetical protein